ncbi:MAG: GH92 family glycosyl hydrolase [Acidobacteriota bacterium]
MTHRSTLRANHRPYPARWIVPGMFLLVFVAGVHAQSSRTSDLSSEVNPLVGTGYGPGEGINLFPGAVVPFGMVQLSPDTEDHGFGYHFTQTQIKGFSMTHMSGPGCANEGDVFFTATTGPVVTQTADFQSPYSHQQEHATPGYYQAQLLQWAIKAELSATEHTGIARFTFPAGKNADILIPLSHTLNETSAASVHIVGDDRIEGYVENHAFCNKTPTYKVYFVMTFSRPFASFGTWTGANYGGPGTVTEGSRSAEQSGHEEWVGAYATWAATSGKQSITAKIGISYVDLAGAERNLHAEAEGKDFSAIRSEAERAWNNELGTIEVSGGKPEERRVFYTALYHSLLMPSRFDDSDGRYLGFDGRVHTVSPTRHIYTNFSGWDIYRSEIPLLAMIEPRRMEDMAQSVVLMYQQGGWVDRWPQINLYTNDMAGSPLSIALATAWLDGLHDFDMDTAWEGMLKDATQAPPPGHPFLGEKGMEWINKVHYVPDDKVDYGSVSEIQEDAVAYASLYRLATTLGKADEAKTLYDRALYYRNVFDPADRYFRPRNADGTWVPNFNPARYEHGFIEGSGWQYQPFAPADLAWVVKAMGRDLFTQRMTEFFDYPEPGWYTKYYNPYNETDLQAPFVFHFSGEPWMTQRVVRRILQENYFDGPDGVPGNDDCGAMSSWAVLAMMGIYSVDPASLAYEVVTPTFSKVVLHLRAPYSGRDFSIEAEGAGANAPYIERVQLNGQPWQKNWISFHSIAAGGSLKIVAGAHPNQEWGAAPADAPPSLSDEKP